MSNWKNTVQQALSLGVEGAAVNQSPLRGRNKATELIQKEQPGFWPSRSPEEVLALAVTAEGPDTIVEDDSGT